MKFTDAVRDQWGGKGGDKKAAAPAKKEAKKDDDEMDLFGDDDEVDEVSLLFNRKTRYLYTIQEAKKKLEEAKQKAKAKVKQVPIAKSLVIFDIKPYEAETDLDALAKDILAIEMDGLLWKTEYKKEPIAYGVNKLMIGCVIEDAKVSTDDL